MWRTFMLLTVLVSAAGAAHPEAQEGGLKAALLRDWTAQKARLVALAEAMPAEKYEFKATPEQRTFGEQMGHLAEAHVSMFKRLDTAGKVPAPDTPKGHGREEIVAFVGAAYDYGQKVLESLSEEALLKSAEADRPVAARTVWAAMNNAANHYGQCVVYLRLNGIVPPASRR